MKQYLNKDQTTKLIELGFPKPADIMVDVFPTKEMSQYVSYKNDLGYIVCRANYSIGELIEFLPKRVGDAQIEFFAGLGNWFVRYEDRYEVPPTTVKQWHSRELIDSLFNACVALKEEEMI